MLGVLAVERAGVVALNGDVAAGDFLQLFLEDLLSSAVGIGGHGGDGEYQGDGIAYVLGGGGFGGFGGSGSISGGCGGGGGFGGGGFGGGGSTAAAGGQGTHGEDQAQAQCKSSSEFHSSSSNMKIFIKRESFSF